MTRPKRTKVEVEFVPESAAAVVARMQEISAAGDGWINFLPGVPQEVADDQPRPTVFSALFGNAQAPVSMCTWLPAKSGGRRTALASIGFIHPRGRRAASQLQDLEAPVPAGWKVQQDNARRGLIVRPPAGTPEADVLRWIVAAGGALAMVPLTGTWKAVVYLPQG